MSNDNTELVSNDTIKNTHNLYVRGSQDTTNQEPEQKQEQDPNNNNDNDNDNLEKHNKKTSLNIIIFITILAAIMTTYYYSVLKLIIKMNLVDTITTDIKIIAIISGLGFSFYLSILFLKKIKKSKDNDQ